MSLKVWRGKDRIFAECTQCGSYGNCPHLQIKSKLDPEIAAALEHHTAHMLALREHYTKAAQSLKAKIASGELPKSEASAKIQELATNHVALVTSAAAMLPDPAGKVTETATACPWCGVVEDVEIEQLPEGAEPPFALAKLVAQEQVKQLKKGK
jgi:hypothetical protein